jgi:diaminohydroxyphosphoribosylaminopyrimidine deaminase/5-amino-6-(5-phosphoribosylamino)uracil reductase
MKLSDSQDSTFMQRALSLAVMGQYTSHPNPRVGCVLVQDNQIVGEGLHWQTGGLHAECNALEGAKEKAYGATVYVTLEPCAHKGRTGPCVDALIQANVKRVVVAALDPNPLVSGKGIQKLKEAGITVDVGLLEKEALALNKGFYSRMQRQHPYVRAKIAMSLDGRVAMENGESQWITSPEARKQGQLWRARSGAILTGSATVLHDNCRLTVRDIERLGLKNESLFRQPLRVIIDSTLSVPGSFAIFHQPGKTIVATSELADLQHKAYGSQVEVVAFAEKEGHIDLQALLFWLGKQEINDVLVEAGPTLVGALLQQDLIDELLVYIAPKLLGSDAKPMAVLPGLSQLSDHIAGEFDRVERVGQDLHLVLNLHR